MRVRAGREGRELVRASEGMEVSRLGAEPTARQVKGGRACGDRPLGRTPTPAQERTNLLGSLFSLAKQGQHAPADRQPTLAGLRTSPLRTEGSPDLVASGRVPRRPVRRVTRQHTRACSRRARHVHLFIGRAKALAAFRGPRPHAASSAAGEEGFRSHSGGPGAPPILEGIQQDGADGPQTCRV
jgi:hypothetical protein